MGDVSVGININRLFKVLNLEELTCSKVLPRSALMIEGKSLLIGILLPVVMCEGCSPAPNVSGGPRHMNEQDLAADGEPLKNNIFSFKEMEVLQPLFTFQNGEDGEYFGIIEALGGGVAAADFDNDSNWDLFFPGGGILHPNDKMTGEPSAFYRNQGDWQFVTGAAFVPPPRVFSHGAAAGDFNEDGFSDILVTGFGAAQLLCNQGDGTFVDTTEAAELSDSSWSSSAAWGDLNGDGFLDVYVAHYVDWSFQNNPKCIQRLENIRDTCPPRSFKPLTDEVFLGLGDGRFVASHAMLGFSQGGSGLGALVVDLDGDVDLDIYVANDGLPNFYYENTEGRFKDVSTSSGADRNDQGMPDGSMGLEAGDFNDDLIPDVWVTNYENESMSLYRSLSPGFYQHASHLMGISGIGSHYVGWGIQLSDFDADGDEDILIATGHALRHPTTTSRFQNPLLLRNDNNHFSNIASDMGDYFSKKHLGRGVAACDLDNNGRVDSVISQMHEPAVVLACSGSVPANWVGLRLVGRRGTRDAIGARVVASTFGKPRLRMIKGGGSYLSSSDQRIVFHLPESQTQISVDITWPSGTKQSAVDLRAGEYHTILEPCGSPAEFGTNYETR